MESDRRSEDGQLDGLAGAFERRRRALERFARWEAENPVVLSPADSFAAVAFLYSLLPPASRTRPVDTAGIATLRQLLAVLGPRR